MDDKLLKTVLDRLDKLEKAVFLGYQHTRRKTIPKGGFAGATGGVRLLLSKGYFKNKRDLPGVRKELSSNGYHYSSQAVHKALKSLSKVTGPLIALKEGGRYYYVERK